MFILLINVNAFNTRYLLCIKMKHNNFIIKILSILVMLVYTRLICAR